MYWRLHDITTQTDALDGGFYHNLCGNALIMEIIHFQERHGPGAQDMHLVSLIFQPADDTFQPLIIAGEPGVSLNEDGLGALEKRLALRGVAYKPIGASALLRRNLLIYGLGGVIVPFIGIKLIDMIVGLFM